MKFNKRYPFFLKEKNLDLSAQQKELLQKEEQKTTSSMEMDVAEDRQEGLKKDLVQICQSLQEVSITTAMLTRQKEELKLHMERKEIKRKKILDALTSKPSKELVTEMVDEVQLTIIDLKEDLLHLETEISEQTAKEEKVKQKLGKTEKEADENRQALEELKEKQALFSSALDFQREMVAEDVRQAENRQKELDDVLQEIRESLQPLTKKSASLVEEKEQLEKEIIKKEKLQQKLLSQKASVEDMEVIDETIADIQASINTKRERLAHIEAKIEKKRAEENQLKLEAAKKEKELDKSKQVICELKQKHSVICSTLEAKRKIFDCQLRQKHQPKEKLPDELKVSASCLTANTSFYSAKLHAIYI